MTTAEIINTVIAGGLLGMLGQGVRVIAGLKKAGDAAASEGKTLTAVFDANQLVVSLLIGFTAGALSILLSDFRGDLNKEAVMAILAAGYAGADFIEAIMKKHGGLPSEQPGKTGMKEPDTPPPAMG